ncbi:MAG: hypothetical protein WAW23_09350, partial [Candidatus Methanoperedens sp.]
VNIALFSYTHIPGSQGNFHDKTEDSTIKHYRTVQIARHLIVEGIASYSYMRFKNGTLTDFGVSSDLLLLIIEKGEAFQTSGCPDCNRPMANETFSKIYNFPRKMNNEEITGIKKELGLADRIPQS